MSRKSALSIVVLMAVGAALAACDSTPSTPAPQPTAVGQGETTPATVPGEGAAGLSLLTGTARANNSPADTGDWAVPNGGVPKGAVARAAAKWVQLTASRAGDLDPVVVNGARLTLYRFDNDSNKPSKSNCNGDCAATWPPVTIAPGGTIFVAGVEQSAIGTVLRNDGRLQVTIDGWPVYRFARDTQPGETLGQGVGGTWFGITPNGQKAGGADAPQDGGPNVPPATSVILFDDANFNDLGPSQGVAGSGCRDVGRAGVASSLITSGSLKLWSGPNCTGRSVVVDGDVADLASINFDDTVASVLFG